MNITLLSGIHYLMSHETLCTADKSFLKNLFHEVCGEMYEIYLMIFCLIWRYDERERTREREREIERE